MKKKWADYRLTRPDRADLASRVIAHRDDDIRFWRVGLGIFIPAFTAQIFDWVIDGLRFLDSKRVYWPIG